MNQEAKKYTVITGASSGIGYETAKAFAARGKNIIAAARRKDNLEALKREVQAEFPAVEVVIRSCDLSVPNNAYQLYSSLKGFRLETWINNAGFGSYDSTAHQDLDRISSMLRLNIEALTILSSLFVRDHQNVPGAQLINVSSAGGYTIVPTAVTYCAAKFYVSAFTEGLAQELQEAGAQLRAKVFAPAATQTEFGQIANLVDEYDYDSHFETYLTSRQASGLLLDLYDSDDTVGLVDRETFLFRRSGPLFAYAGNSSHNQRIDEIEPDKKSLLH